ncbi:MAG TPA: hypothetical protein VFL83_11140 [Anaeromyxobacter sp.]|nr:hypothetical protein [Anaeromyxobacter sp.]
MRALNVAAIAVLGFFFALDLSDIAHWLHRPGDYRFGSEVAGFAYASAGHFVGSRAFLAVLAVAGMVGPARLKSLRARVACRTGVSVIVYALAVTLARK